MSAEVSSTPRTMHLVIATSLSTTSRSTQLARRLERALAAAHQPVTLLTLRDRTLPLCDGDASQKHPEVLDLARHIRAARTVTLAVPIYNYDVGPSARNLVALAGAAFQDKIVAVLCAAGGQRSYMAALGLANSLMLDFRARIVPRFVYASARGRDRTDELLQPEIQERLDELARELVRFARADRRERELDAASVDRPLSPTGNPSCDSELSP